MRLKHSGRRESSSHAGGVAGGRRRIDQGQSQKMFASCAQVSSHSISQHDGIEPQIGIAQSVSSHPGVPFASQQVLQPGILVK